MGRDFYPRPPRGGRPDAPKPEDPRALISIHALREEGDQRAVPENREGGNFYPRPPRGGRLAHRVRVTLSIEFLSTPSARRATPALRSSKKSRCNFYPRPPRGGRPATGSGSTIRGISIHALREEGDGRTHTVFQPDRVFLSTPSARRATRTDVVGRREKTEFLSTPSARRATLPASTAKALAFDFYPRPPRGGRHGWWTASASLRIFLSTPSARRATRQGCTALFGFLISIHALREEGDRRSDSAALGGLRFLSTPSARRATCRNGSRCRNR